MKINILGVEIDDFCATEVMDLMAGNLRTGKKTFIATPNPEMLVAARKDKDFARVLNGADIKIADGIGLKLGAKILKKELKNRVAGTDLMNTICVQSAANGWKVYLLGAEQGIARMAAENLKKSNPGLIICGAESGGGMDGWDSRVIIEHINALAPDILFVALGHGKQEKWIVANLEKMPSVKMAMGVGGAFDFFAGKAKRAPRWMRNAGLEWLWRLIKEPKRYKRILTAIIIFPLFCWLYGGKK